MLSLYFGEIYFILCGVLILDAVLPLKEVTPAAVLAHVLLQIWSNKFTVPKMLRSLFLYLYFFHDANTLLLV